MNTTQKHWTPTPEMRAKALTRAWILFMDGGRIHWASLDSSGRYHVESPRQYGINGLKTRIKEKYPTQLKEVRLYDNQTGEFLELWMENGIWLV